MATTTIIIIIAAYIIGLVVTLFIVKKWTNPLVEKLFAVFFWPCTWILCFIHWIHMKLVK